MKSLRDGIQRGIALLLLVALLCPPSLAQAGRGDLFMSGVIRDPEGLPVAGARVKAVLEGRPHVERETKTDEYGKWTLLYLRKGLWLVSAFTSEMTSELTDVNLNVNKRDVALPLTRTASGILIEAKTAVFQEDYEKAVQILSWFIPNFPDSREQASALFWISHAHYQLSRNQEDRDKALKSLRDALPFLDRLIVEFPKSEWTDDAEILRIELALRLCQRGLTEYARIIEDGLANENRAELDIRLAALDALSYLDRARAVGLLSGIVLRDPDPEIRGKAVMILGKMGIEETDTLLKKVAMNDTDSGVRRAAFMWLGRKEAGVIPRRTYSRIGSRRTVKGLTRVSPPALRVSL
jgi:tetratricopeptide (TPR) repeat protein